MRRIIAVLLTCLLTLALSNQLALAADADRPNVVLIMCDDLGWGDVGFNGGTVIKTPHLDAMAASGLTLTRFYAASAVCSPTRGSVITGRHPYRYGIPFANTGHMKPPELTLAELLRKLGYTTGHFGKWHLGTLTTEIKDANRGKPGNTKDYAPPQDHGFDVCFSTESKVPTWDPMLKPKKGASGKGWDYIADDADAEDYGTYYWNERGERVTDNLRGDDSRVIVDRAVPFINSAAKAGKPFFAIVWFHTPHLPVVAGPEHAKMYAEFDSFKKNYYGCVTAMDEQVGRLRATLREAGVADNTLVAFTSDNGPEGGTESPGSAGPFRGRKRDLFEGGVRVPSLIEWPARIKPGTSSDIPAVTSDYLPTILNIVGVDMPDDRPIDGVSLLPLFDGKMTERPSPIGFEISGRVALSDNRYKLLRYPKGSSERSSNAKFDGEWMLFDLIDDPGEKNDIADKHPEIVKHMAATLEAWRESCRRSDEGADYPQSE